MPSEGGSESSLPPVAGRVAALIAAGNRREGQGFDERRKQTAI